MDYYQTRMSQSLLGNPRGGEEDAESGTSVVRKGDQTITRLSPVYAIKGNPTERKDPKRFSQGVWGVETHRSERKRP